MTEAALGGLSLDDAEHEIYASIVARSPEHDFEPTLDRVAEACALLGDPQRAYRVIHITGTNGKTSTARMTEALVREYGLRTGLFTSPHLSSVRERIQIDGKPISQAAFVALWLDVAPIINLVDEHSRAAGGPRLSFFEVFTVLAFAAFADAPVDVAIIEVGMGGGWDSTNVADGDVAVIAPVAMDHAKWLGDTIADIAAEKAGIIKDGAVVVVAEQTEPALQAIAAAADERGATVEWEGEQIEVVERQPGVGGQLLTLRTPAATYAEIFLPLYGEHQAHNALLALAAVEALLADGGAPRSLEGELVEAAFGNVTSPGRLEAVRTSPLILVDAAHNPHGIDALVAALGEGFSFSSLVGIVGILNDKDADGILGGLEPVLDHVVITEVGSPRTLSAEDLARIARGIFGEDRVTIEAKLPNAIDAATGIAERETDLGAGVIIVGSVLLVAEARTLLEADRPKGIGHIR